MTIDDEHATRRYSKVGAVATSTVETSSKSGKLSTSMVPLPVYSWPIRSYGVCVVGRWYGRYTVSKKCSPLRCQHISLTSYWNLCSFTILNFFASITLTISFYWSISTQPYEHKLWYMKLCYVRTLLPTAMWLPSGLHAILIFCPPVLMVATALAAITLHTCI